MLLRLGQRLGQALWLSVAQTSKVHAEGLGEGPEGPRGPRGPRLCDLRERNHRLSEKQVEADTQYVAYGPDHVILNFIISFIKLCRILHIYIIS